MMTLLETTETDFFGEKKCLFKFRGKKICDAVTAIQQQHLQQLHVFACALLLLLLLLLRF
jgi:hypothetical protein